MQADNQKLYMVDNPTLGPTTYQKRHVFLDIDNLTEWGLGIYQHFPKPEVVETTGLECGPAGSWDSRINAGLGTVLYEDGLFRCWGFCMTTIEHLDENADVNLSMYAESSDGIHWVKPDLKLVGQKRWPGNNLINLPGSILSVSHPLPGAGMKYLACATRVIPPHYSVFGTDETTFKKTGYLEFTEGGTYLYGSDDGIDWWQITKNPIIRHGDIARVHVDPLRQRYLLTQKLGVNHGLTSRRSMITLESKDLIHWQGYDGYRQWHESFPLDDYDDLLAMQHGKKIGEYYGQGFYQIGSLYIAIEEFYLTGLPLAQFAGQNPAGITQLRLAFSHDGLHWRHPQGRPTFVDPGLPGNFDTGFLTTPSTITEVGDEMRIYFQGMRPDHGFGITLDFHLDPDLPFEEQDDVTQFYFARFKRDRFASLASTYKSTFDVEIGPRQGTELTINAITRGRGSIRMAIAEQRYPLHLEPRKTDSLPGFSFDDCIPFQGDEVWAPVRFKHKSLAEIPEGMALILRFEIDGAEVFGYEWHD